MLRPTLDCTFVNWVLANRRVIDYSVSDRQAVSHRADVEESWHHLKFHRRRTSTFLSRDEVVGSKTIGKKVDGVSIGLREIW